MPTLLDAKGASIDALAYDLTLEGETDAQAAAEQVAAADAKVVAIRFPSFVDGRGHTLAKRLKAYHGFTGTLVAVGAVTHDRLREMLWTGFDAFELREGEDAGACAKALAEVSVQYMPTSLDPRPLFRRAARPGAPANAPAISHAVPHELAAAGQQAAVAGAAGEGAAR